MRPGPDQIIACPHCGRLARFRTWLSFTSFGEIAWSDGKRELLGIKPPCPPTVVRCRHCAQCYWLAEARKVGAVTQWSGEDRQADPALGTAQEVDEPTEENYYQALQSSLAKCPQQERTPRMLAWWRRNDSLRSHPAGGATAYGECMRNLEALARLLDEGNESDRLLKAEVLRELGEFEAAKGLLRRPGSALYCGAARQLRDLCDRGDRSVRQLSFEESQDVGALIEMAKGTGRRAAPVLVELLGDERDMVRGMAAKMLGESGRHAKPAIPAIQRALEDESCYVRMYAERALRSLASL
jgi:hypothetical protein